MLKYIARRLVILIPELWIITIIVFTLLQLSPGDFLDQYRLDPSVSKETLRAMEREYGLDKPAVVQYFYWLGKVVRFDFGQSFYYRRPVASLIYERLLGTLVLSLYSFVLSWIIGVVLGVVSALKKYTLTDKILTVVAFSGLAVPGFSLHCFCCTWQRRQDGSQ